MSSMLQRYNGENFPKVDGLRFSLPFLRFTFLLKISPDAVSYTHLTLPTIA